MVELGPLGLVCVSPGAERAGVRFVALKPLPSDTKLCWRCLPGAPCAGNCPNQSGSSRSWPFPGAGGTGRFVGGKFGGKVNVNRNCRMFFTCFTSWVAAEEQITMAVRFPGNFWISQHPQRSAHSSKTSRGGVPGGESVLQDFHALHISKAVCQLLSREA